MSNALTKLETIKSDGRIIDFVSSTVFHGQRYYDKQTGRQISFVAQIKSWYPEISKPSIQQALRQLRGTEPASRPLGRPPKATRIDAVAPARSSGGLSDPTLDDGIAEPPKVLKTGPVRFQRYQLVERIDRRTGSSFYGVFDKKWEEETLAGSYREALAEIDRLQKVDQPVTVGFHKNGKQIIVCNSDSDHTKNAEAVSREDENEANSED